jgi:signal transduction histidine kinase/DNA-binding response OmpR family regulator
LKIKRSIIIGAAAVFILLSLIGLFILHLYNMEAMYLENAVFIEKDKLKDDMIYLESLLENDHSIVHLENGDYINEHEQTFSPVYHRALIENMAHNMGIEVAIYIKENNNFHCITSSIVDSNGKSAVDIFLGEQNAAYGSIQSGMDYIGKDVILDNEYLTLYRPLFQPDTDEVIGILFTGIKMTAIKNIISHKNNEMAVYTILIRSCGIVLGTLLIVILITILVRIIAESNMAKERLRIIFDTMPLGANIHSKNMDFFDCNDSVIKLFELSSRQELVKNFKQLSPMYQPDGKLSIEKMQEVINKAYTEGYLRFEWIHQKLNGEPIPCEVTLVRTKQGKDFIVTAFIRDLRESKRMMNEIHQREKLLNMVNKVAEILLSINDEKLFESSLLKSFELIGQCMDVDRVQILRNEILDGELHCILAYEWLSQYANSSIINQPIGTSLSYNISPEFKQLFMYGGHINVSISILPEKESSFFKTFGVKSIVIIPIFLESNFWGLFSIDDCQKEHTFTDDEIHILTSMGLMMTNAINKNLQLGRTRETNERIQVIFNAMPLGASYIDVNSNILDCNDEMVKIFGLSSKQEYLERFLELSPEYQPDGSLSKKKIYESLDKAFEDGYFHVECMHQNLKGEPIPCEITLVRVKHNNEFVLAAYMRDLRELKAAITQKNESEQSLNILKSILNGIDAMIYVTVPETDEILFINNYMRKVFNLKEDCIGQLCYKVFLNDADEKCDFCPCRQLDKAPDSIVVWEKENPLTKRIHHNTDRYIEWQNGRIVHIQHSVDVTDLIRAKEQAEQSSRFKSQFLSRMSHEVRTPMNAILGITEIQLQDETLLPDMREAMNKIFNSGYLLLGIINDILDLSKIEAGKLELLPAVYDFQNLINDTIQITVVYYENKPIDFSLQVDENIPLTLFGDELRIKQILNNLLSNAFKYTDKGGISLSVDAEYTQQEGEVTLVFRIADTGQGMTGEQVEKLFDEYTRFNMEINRTIEGTGLGMNIAKQLVQMMNGELIVESKPGKGSVFTVRLPQKIIGSGVLGRELTENIKQFNIGKITQTNKTPQFVREYMPYGRVLVVDDVETNLYVARGLMAPYGLSIETATSGFEAIEKVKGGATFDIIFMDHFMPKMDGIEATRILRDRGYTHPIIALTANALIGQAEMFLENGFDGFISKPINIRQLNASLNKLIRDKYPSEVVEAARQQSAKIMAKSLAEKLQPSSGPEITAIFIRDAEKAHARLKTIVTNAFRRDDDFRQYVINIHSMKSALANIGEDWLSGIAFKLELAGRAENISVIMSETPAFLEALSKVIEKNRAKDADNNTAAEDSGDLAYMAEKLRIIKTACEKYDEVATNKALSELRQKKWPLYTKAMLDTIAEHLLHSDFEEIVKLAEDYETANVASK